MEVPQIKVEYDYGRFKLLEGNRSISQQKVRRIIRDNESGLDIFPYCPILVAPSGDDLHIIDGQHRYEACRSLGKPIFYVICDGVDLKEIARINSNTDKWKNKDFIHCYASLGNPDYEYVYSFMRKYKLSLSVAVSLLMYDKVAGGGSVMNDFKDGKFQVRHWESALEFMELVDDLFSQYSFYRDRNLLKALHVLYKNNKTWDLDRMKKKLQENRKIVDKQSAARTYLYMLEHIYNMNELQRTTFV